ncbi:Eukaryotic/viral aspartic protease [Phytophthora megakarya]|uniref:Eukaryotic/viral aspartic protease n=1 Tax=Phytophthora megakarya TaxID=4795 RepID=A0A225UXY1_9STRA|nr:Eukaryotic/viral aspartic protease [Phytophthora megakarya]
MWSSMENVVYYDWLVSICEAGEGAPVHAKTVKLLPGERMGWWSSQRFDQRVRMRALVRGAVNDVRTSILLDTGANVSIITTKLAR